MWDLARSADGSRTVQLRPEVVRAGTCRPAIRSTTSSRSRYRLRLGRAAPVAQSSPPPPPRPRRLRSGEVR